VIGASAGERNFHAFYYLVAGATLEERQHLHLDGGETFRYLSHHRGSGASATLDAAKFIQLKEAFKAVGFPKRAVASICQILSAILHLGNLDFYIDRYRNADSAVVKNPHSLEIVADFLGVESSALEFALTNKSMLVSGEMCGIFLDAEGAAANRDDLAKALYGLVFSWIGEYLNQKLCRDDFSTFISVVDFPGPVQAAASHRDGLGIDAFVVNLASERLLAFTMEQLFESDKAEYDSEGISSSLPGLSVSRVGTSDCLHLLTNNPGGLVHIIDDQSGRKGKTDDTMLAAMNKRWGNHVSFGSRVGDAGLGRPGTFLCSHWNGQVTYSTENCLAHNSSALSPNFVALLGGTTPHVGADGRTTPGSRDALSSGGSSLSFVRQLFASGAVETVAHPRSDDTIVGASQMVAPSRQPSTRRTGGRRGGDDTDVKVAHKDAPTIIKQFDSSVTLLLSTLAGTKSWHIFCLRPNDAQLPNQVNAKLLKHQIRTLGLPEMAKRLQGEWSVNVEHGEWWERYQSIPPYQEAAQILLPYVFRDKAIKAKELMGWSEQEMAVGKTKVSRIFSFLLSRLVLTDSTSRSSSAMLPSASSRTTCEQRTSRSTSATRIESSATPVPTSPTTPTLPTSPSTLQDSPTTTEGSRRRTRRPLSPSSLSTERTATTTLTTRRSTPRTTTSRNAPLVPPTTHDRCSTAT
jgi:chitin synthase